MVKRIDHVTLDVADIDRSIEFYETNFGCNNILNTPLVVDCGLPSFVLGIQSRN